MLPICVFFLHFWKMWTNWTYPLFANDCYTSWCWYQPPVSWRLLSSFKSIVNKPGHRAMHVFSVKSPVVVVREKEGENSLYMYQSSAYHPILNHNRVPSFSHVIIYYVEAKVAHNRACMCWLGLLPSGKYHCQDWPCTVAIISVIICRMKLLNTLISINPEIL